MIKWKFIRAKNNTVKRTRFILFAVLFGMSLLLLLEMTYLRGVSSHSGTPKNLYLLEAVIRLIRNDYLEEKDPVQVMEGSFKGMVNSLDSLSGYLDADATKRFLDRQSGAFQEPGLVLFKRYGAFPQVTGIVENSPAEKQGLKWGDLITEIDGRPTPAMSLMEVNLLLGDSEVYPLPIKVLRGEKTIELEVERAPLFSEPVTLEKYKGTSGILKVHRLSPPCVTEIETKIMPGLKKGKDPFVIDLRNCREGDFEETRKFINLFIKSESVGYFEKRGGDKEIIASPDDPALGRLPLIIWINQGTVGPAEVAAAVLQEFKSAQLVGLATPGLAARYEFHLLEDGTSLLLTSGIFSLNSGVKIWGSGAEPDIAVDVDDQDLAAFLRKTQPLLSAS